MFCSLKISGASKNYAGENENPIRLKITRESKNPDRESLKITIESKNYYLKITIISKNCRLKILVRACMYARVYD